MSSSPISGGRRGFIARAATALAALGLGVPTVVRASGHEFQDPSEHDAWMRPLTGKHKQFFHAIDLTEFPMAMTMNYLNVYRDAFGSKDGEVSAAIGVQSGALALGFTDAAWAKYGFGQSANVMDPETKQPATRNIFAVGGPASIDAVQKRGVVFLMCNQAMRRLSRLLAAARGENADAIYEDLKASRLPGTIVVPAMVIAVNRAQEAGFTYLRV